MRRLSLEKIRSHALETPNVEVCGFLVNVLGSEEIIKAHNISSSPDKFFTIAPEDYILAEKLGSIVAIYHSHPSSDLASDGDKASCSRGSLPWIIYSVASDKFDYLESDQSIAPLLGRQFIWGVYDCGTLIRDYYKSNLNVDLVYTPYEPMFWKDPNSEPYMDKLMRNGFVPVDSLQVNDIILMQLLSSDVPNHVAVYVENGMILNHVSKRLSSREVYGGYWREVTKCYMRHRSQI